MSASRSLTYDAKGVLAQVTATTSGPLGGVQTHSTTRTSDGDGRLVAVAATDASGAVTSTALTWDGARAVPRLATASTAGADTNLVVGASLAVAVRGGQADPFAADAHGSVLARGEASDLARAEAYDEFGTPVPTSPQGLVDELLGEAGAGASALRFGYRGEVTLDGLAHLRARDYAPRLGRFTTQDPLDGVAGTTTVANPNPYAANDPLNQVDPLGLSPAKDGELRLSAAARARETQQLLAQELRRQGLAYAQLEQANRAARMLPTESLIAWRETARRANSSTSLWSNLTMSDAMGGLRSFGHGLRGGDCSTQASTTMLSCAIGEATFIVEAELTALSIGVRTSKSSAPNTAGLADDVVGPSVRYNRSAHCGGVQTNSPAGRALREGAEGTACPSCGRSQISGTNTAPVPEHSPIVARALLRRRPRDDRRATPGIRPKRRRLRRDDVLDVPTLAGRIVVAAVSVVHGALGLVMVGAEEVRDAVRRHLEGFWPDHPQEEFSWTLGPIEERLPGFRVRRIAPVKPTDPWVYVTVGASDATDGDGMEFFILSPSESPRHVETLAMVASFHADARYRLSVGRTVNIGRPWIDGAAADHLLVSLPYPYGPSLEHCDARGRHVRLLWLVPITEAEARYVGERGLAALEQLLEQSDADVISPARRSLV